MTDESKLVQLKALLQITDTTQDATLAVYLTLARDEILSWLYSGKTPEGVSDVPARYEPTQVMSVVAGYGLQGAENQTAHSENGISRTFKYEDMISYIRSHVAAYVGVV
jgi:hypothetical protein